MSNKDFVKNEEGLPHPPKFMTRDEELQVKKLLKNMIRLEVVGPLECKTIFRWAFHLDMALESDIHFSVNEIKGLIEWSVFSRKKKSGGMSVSPHVLKQIGRIIDHCIQIPYSDLSSFIVVTKSQSVRLSNVQLQFIVSLIVDFVEYCRTNSEEFDHLVKHSRKESVRDYKAGLYLRNSEE